MWLSSPYGLIKINSLIHAGCHTGILLIKKFLTLVDFKRKKKTFKNEHNKYPDSKIEILPTGPDKPERAKAANRNTVRKEWTIFSTVLVHNIIDYLGFYTSGWSHVGLIFTKLTAYTFREKEARPGDDFSKKILDVFSYFLFNRHLSWHVFNEYNSLHLSYSVKIKFYSRFCPDWKCGFSVPLPHVGLYI